METGSVLTFPAPGTSHPLSDTLQKALETLKIHQQWISNRKSPASVMPEETETRFPKRDAWRAQDEAPVDTTDTSPTSKHAHLNFPPVKRKSAGLFTSSLTNSRIHSGVVSPSGRANMEKNAPLQPPKAAINAWSGPDITSEETLVDIEEDKSPVVEEKLSLGVGNDRKKKKRKKKPPPGVQSNATKSSAAENVDIQSAANLKVEQASATNSEVLHGISSPSGDIVASQLVCSKDNENVSTDNIPILNDSIKPEADTHSEGEQMEADFDSHVVAVSPAPIPQQISLSSSSQSKLRMSETEAHRLENNTAVSASSRHEHSSVMEFSMHSADTNRKTKIVTDSVMHVVMPQQQNEHQGQAAVTYHHNKSVTIDSVVSKVDSDGVEIIQESVEEASDTDSSSVVEDGVTEDSAIVSPAKALNFPKLTDPNEMVRQLPNIMDRSSSTVSIVDDRRSHSPPPYLVHKKHVVPPPPCPRYGTKQPAVLPMTPVSIKRHSGDSPAPVMVKEPATILSVKPITPANEEETSVTLPSDTSSTPQVMSPNDDSHVVTADDEPDLSSQPLPPDASQYFVSTSGNQRKQELPALHKAASLGKIHTIQHLLNHGADVNQTDADGKMALMYCIHPKGIHLASADLLIKEGTNLDHQSNDGSTVLHLAAYQGAVSLVELLLLNGAQVDLRDKDGRLPIHWATHPSSTKCINIILKTSLYGVDDVDKANMTCLMWACFHNNVNIAAFLLDKHADKEEKDIDGMTAMHWAVHVDDVKCLKLLLSPNMTYFKDKLGRTVMHTAAEKGSCKACEVILNLRLDAVYDTDKKGRTPLHWAAVYNKVDTCALLLDRGADASQRDNCGKSSLDYARVKGHDYVVAMLTSHETSQSDFARVSRSASLSTLRSRVPSFGELPRSPLVRSTSHLSDDIDGEEDTASAAITSPSVISEESSEGDKILVEKGCYLGLFTKYGKGPVEHHFFRLDKKKKVLLHSRDDNANPKQIEELKLLSVQPSPSLTIRNRLDYVPLDLHKYAFCIITTNTGPLDVVAYTARAYNGWLRELTKLCQQQEATAEDHSYIGGSLDNLSTISGLTMPSGADDGWTENSFVRNPIGNSPVASNSQFFSSGRNSAAKTASKSKSNVHQTIEEEPIDDGSTVISNPTVFTSTPNKPQPDHLPSSIVNNDNDDIV